MCPASLLLASLAACMQQSIDMRPLLLLLRVAGCLDHAWGLIRLTYCAGLEPLAAADAGHALFITLLLLTMLTCCAVLCCVQGACGHGPVPHVALSRPCPVSGVTPQWQVSHKLGRPFR